MQVMVQVLKERPWKRWEKSSPLLLLTSVQPIFWLTHFLMPWKRSYIFRSWNPKFGRRVFTVDKVIFHFTDGSESQFPNYQAISFGLNMPQRKTTIWMNTDTEKHFKFIFMLISPFTCTETYSVFLNGGYIWRNEEMCYFVSYNWKVSKVRIHNHATSQLTHQCRTLLQ